MDMVLDEQTIYHLHCIEIAKNGECSRVCKLKSTDIT